MSGIKLLICSRDNLVNGALAHKLFEERLEDRHAVESGALENEPNRRPENLTIRLALKYGVDLYDWHSSEVNERKLEWADMIIVINYQDYCQLEEWDNKLEYLTSWHPRIDGGIEPGHGKAEGVKKHNFMIIDECVDRASEVINNTW